MKQIKKNAELSINQSTKHESQNDNFTSNSDSDDSDDDHFDAYAEHTDESGKIEKSNNNPSNFSNQEKSEKEKMEEKMQKEYDDKYRRFILERREFIKGVHKTTLPPDAESSNKRQKQGGNNGKYAIINALTKLTGGNYKKLPKTNSKFFNYF